MIRGPAQVDFEAALQDPKAFFSEPQDVVDYPEFSRERKLAILRRWQEDAIHLSTSEAEGMVGGEENMLGRVEHALHVLSEGHG